MNDSPQDQLYHELCDDAQTYIGMANMKLIKAQAMLMASGHPGVRMKNRDAKAIVDTLSDQREAIDQLPAELNPETKS